MCHDAQSGEDPKIRPEIRVPCGDSPAGDGTASVSVCVAASQPNGRYSGLQDRTVPRDGANAPQPQDEPEARNRALAGLRARWPEVTFDIRQDHGQARPFGWVFPVDVAVPDNGTADDQDLPRLVAVLHESGQVLGTARDHTPARFAALCQNLLAFARQRGEAWCLTMSGPSLAGLDIAAMARRDGLEEIVPARAISATENTGN